MLLNLNNNTPGNIDGVYDRNTASAIDLFGHANDIKYKIPNYDIRTTFKDVSSLHEKNAEDMSVAPAINKEMHSPSSEQDKHHDPNNIIHVLRSKLNFILE